MAEELLDMTSVTTLIDLLDDFVDELHEVPVHAEVREVREGETVNKAKMRSSAQRSRDLLYAAHLADLIRAEVISKYHQFKGQDPPTIATQ